MFYVTIIRAKKVGYLAGPFDSHDVALRHVEPARKLACQLDPWADFDAFGTAKVDTRKPGVLNTRLGL